MPSKPPQPAGRRIETRQSGVHGKGVFAAQDIAAGDTLIEYLGEIISWKEALRRHPHDPAQPNHTFYFHIDDKNVIDGKVHGNAAKWINHACDPNCEADEVGGRIFIKALRDIPAGEELNYDYGLVIDLPYTPELLAEFPCWCGSENCRGTLLAAKPEKAGKKKRKKKSESGAGDAEVKTKTKTKTKLEKKANRKDRKDKDEKKAGKSKDAKSGSAGSGKKAKR